jgi:ribulose kinase
MTIHLTDFLSVTATGIIHKSLCLKRFKTVFVNDNGKKVSSTVEGHY